jgi:hypothetical protein
MNKEEIVKEIESLNTQILDLTSKRDSLQKTLLNSVNSIEEKFRIWYHGDDSTKNEYEWLIDKKEFPNLRKLYDNWDLHRYETYYVLEDLCDYFDPILYPEDYEDENISEEDRRKALDLAEEVMNNNIMSFKCDW